jgi:hypothetical protein
MLVWQIDACFLILDKQTEQRRCQIRLIFVLKSRNLLNLMPKIKISIHSHRDGRLLSLIGAGRKEPGWISGPGKKVPVHSREDRSCRMTHAVAKAFSGIA